MIVDFGAIWVWITQNLLPIISIIAFAYMFYMNWRVRPLLKMAQRLASQWGHMMVEKREEKKGILPLTDIQKSSRHKIAKAIKEKVPFNLLKDHNDAEIIGLLADEELMKGAMFLGKTGEQVASKIASFFQPHKKESRFNIDKVPEIK